MSGDRYSAEPVSGMRPKEAPASKPESDGSELARLFQEHNASLVQLLRARLRSDQEARDVAQEAYVKLLQLDRLGTVSYLRTYLFRTALNIATDRLRSAAVHAVAHQDPVFDARVDELTPEKTALAEEELQMVEEALAKLPSQERYAFFLHRIADLDVDEIAKRLGVTGRSVRNYIIRALLCCRQALGEARDLHKKDMGKTGGRR